MAIIKEYRIGNTTIKIADDAIRKTPGEVDEMIKKLSKVAWECVIAARKAGKDI